MTLLAVLVLNVTQVMAAAHSGVVASEQATGKVIFATVGALERATADKAVCAAADDCEPEPTECVWSSSILTAIQPSSLAHSPAQIVVKIHNPAVITTRSGITPPLQDRPPRLLSI